MGCLAVRYDLADVVASPKEQKQAVSELPPVEPLDNAITKALTSAPAPLLLTTRQAAAALAISERTLFRLVKTGMIPAVHLSAALRFDPRDLAALIDRLKSPMEAM